MLEKEGPVASYSDLGVFVKGNVSFFSKLLLGQSILDFSSYLNPDLGHLLMNEGTVVHSFFEDEHASLTLPLPHPEF